MGIECKGTPLKISKREVIESNLWFSEILPAALGRVGCREQSIEIGREGLAVAEPQERCWWWELPLRPEGECRGGEDATKLWVVEGTR